MHADEGQKGREETRSKGRFTPRQGQYLAFIHHYTRLHRQPPAEVDIAKYFRVSPPSVHGMIVALEKRGLIERVPGQARSLRVRIPPEELPDLDGALPQPWRPATLEGRYPHIRDWVMDDGWIEIGRTEGSRSLVRALDGGGMVWEGKVRYASLDDLLQDLEAGLSRWREENG